LWRTVRDGGLAPQLASALRRTGLLDDCERRIADALHSAVEVNALRNALLRRAALEATRALNAAGISPLWFKGVWLASHVYAQAALRPMNDIDLLVPEGAGAAACDVLHGIGYSRQPTASEGGAAAWNVTLSRRCSLPGGATSLEIDLHERLRLSRVVVWPPSTLWATAAEVRVAGATFRIPAPEAGLLYGAVHLFKHGLDLRHALTAICDAAATITATGSDLDTGWLATRLEQPLNATALYMLLRLVDRQPTTQSEQLLQAARAQVERHGARRQADAIVASARRLPLMTSDDFSLFDVGESAAGWSRLRKLAQGTTRWRRRVNVAARTAPGMPLARLLRRASWRYAYTSYMAGRLSARLEASIPS
jgi:hypothetical protein